MLLLNAAELDQLGDRAPFDLVIFWGSLEHMTVPERVSASPSRLLFCT
jgi:hypothetical protein